MFHNNKHIVEFKEKSESLNTCFVEKCITVTIDFANRKLIS